MVPDWAPHARCWMAWPCREAPWGGGLDEARRTYAEVAQAIARFEPVTMIARPELVAMASLYCGPGITTLALPHDDGWVRDIGPCFLGNAAGEVAGVTWAFNGWGELHTDYAQDADLGAPAARACRRPPLRLPRWCWRRVRSRSTARAPASPAIGPVLDPKRNPGLTLAEAEAELMRQLGVDKVIWLPAGLVDDEAGGHVDNVAIFARPGLVLALATDDRADPAYGGLAENLDVLRGVGRRARPHPRGGDRAAAEGAPPARRPAPALSHLNCYLANGAVIMPSFGDATDKVAAKAFAAAWPGREIVPIDALDLVQGGGGIHGITLGQPARVMALEPTIELSDAPGEADAEFLLRGLIADNQPYLGALDHRRLCLMAHVEDEPVGGLIAETARGLLFIDMFWLAPELPPPRPRLPPPARRRGRGAPPRLPDGLARHLRFPGPPVLRAPRLCGVRRAGRPAQRPPPLLHEQAAGRLSRRPVAPGSSRP